MTAPEVLAALAPVVEALTQLGVPYQIGGSVASSLYGVARSTLDVDIVADLSENHARDFSSALRGSYFVEEDAVRDAVRRQGSFNVIHLDTMLKVDVFVLKSDAYERQAFSRGRVTRLEEGEGGRRFHVGSPEDVILHKLAWYRSGGEVSERQWRDVLGVLEVQGETLDRAYLRRWATHLEVEDLLERALLDAG